MKGRAHLDWLQLLQLNKCGWMIISFPPRNKRKRRQCWIITLSKTIKSDFEVAAPPNLSHISAAEMAFWAQPAGAVGPLRLGPRGRAPARSCVQRSAAAGLLSVFPPTERLSPQLSQEASHDPPPCIESSWARVQSGSTRARTSLGSGHCVNKHTKVVGRRRLRLHVVLLFLWKY